MTRWLLCLLTSLLLSGAAPSLRGQSSASAPATQTAPGTRTVYNAVGGFRYTIPEGWQELPEEAWGPVLESYRAMGARQLLQPAGTAALSLPRIIVIGQSQKRKNGDGEEFARRFKQEQEQAIPAGARDRLKLRVNDATWDAATGRVTTDSVLEDGGEIVYHTRGVFFIGPGGLAGFLLHAHPGTLAPGDAALRQTVGTVRLDDAPPAASDGQKQLMYICLAIIGGVVAMVVVRNRRPQPRQG